MTLHFDTESFHSKSVAHLIDCVHTAFDRRRLPLRASSTHSADAWYISRLLVHEWVANLVQHADFRGSSPEISINFETTDDRVRYVVEDNSAGFDLETYHLEHGEVDTPLPDRGMGLLILSACSDEVVYRRVGPQRNRLEFVLCRKAGHVDVGAEAFEAMS